MATWGEKDNKTSSDSGDDRTGINVLALRRNMTLRGILGGPRDRLEEMPASYDDHAIQPVVLCVTSASAEAM